MTTKIPSEQLEFHHKGTKVRNWIRTVRKDHKGHEDKKTSRRGCNGRKGKTEYEIAAKDRKERKKDIPTADEHGCTQIGVVTRGAEGSQRGEIVWSGRG